MTGTMTWAAMDVHARSTYAASLDVVTGELSRQRFDTGAVEPVVGWLAGLPGPVRCCYEAGPTGFGLYRAAVAAGIDCQVIAPSKTPRPSGDRNKSDRRDTDLLLRQLMAGGLTAVVVPSATCEAARDLARAREQVRVDLMRCRHRLSKLLLRHGRVWDRSAWTKVHREWLSAQTFEQAGTELAFIDNLAACDGLTARKDALDERLSSVVSDPEFWPLVRRLRAFRGIDTLSALIIVLEVCRLHPLLARGAARIVAGAGALPRAVRRVRSPWVDHQDRLEVRPADPGRGGLALRPPAEDRADALRAPGGAARPCPANRTTRPEPPLPDPPADAGAQQAGQRDHRRVRARARLLPLGGRHCAVAHTDSPSPLGWGGAGPRSPLVRATVLWAALTRPRPILDTRQPATQPGTWGSQPPHMRLTDVENFARRLPTRATPPTNPPNDSTEGTFNAAHLTDAPPYEHHPRPGLRLVAIAMARRIPAAKSRAVAPAAGTRRPSRGAPLQAP